mgnify:CR=1 FL=1
MNKLVPELERPLFFFRGRLLFWKKAMVVNALRKNCLVNEKLEEMKQVFPLIGGSVGKDFFWGLSWYLILQRENPSHFIPATWWNG